MIDPVTRIGFRPISEALHKDAQPRAEANAAPAKTVALKSQISDLTREASAGPVGVDAAKVSDIRNAISNGSYKVAPEALAASILKFYRGK